MRLLAICLVLFALPLAACDSKAPPAAPVAETPAATVPAVKAPLPAIKAAAVPAGADPMFGNWSVDLDRCEDPAAVTAVSATSLSAGGSTCDLSLADNGDGSFTGSCGGAKLKMTPVFAPTGEGINVVFPDGKKQTLLRCGR